MSCQALPPSQLSQFTSATSLGYGLQILDCSVALGLTANGKGGFQASSWIILRQVPPSYGKPRVPLGDQAISWCSGPTSLPIPRPGWGTKTDDFSRLNRLGERRTPVVEMAKSRRAVESKSRRSGDDLYSKIHSMPSFAKSLAAIVIAPTGTSKQKFRHRGDGLANHR